MQLVHEERRIFGSLSVEENIVIAGITAPKRWALARIYEMFPRLKERRSNRGTELSGGEQQMLAIARAMMQRPRVLMCDEPSLGLAPAITQELFGVLQDLAQNRSMSILVVEQNAHLTLEIAERAYVIEHGAIELEGTAAELKSNDTVRRAYLGLAA
jgi:branched-chain amino acid transport system ATP-binding protein